jgi:hypothetical protein
VSPCRTVRAPDLGEPVGARRFGEEPELGADQLQEVEGVDTGNLDRTSRSLDGAVAGPQLPPVEQEVEPALVRGEGADEIVVPGEAGQPLGLAVVQDVPELELGRGLGLGPEEEDIPSGRDELRITEIGLRQLSVSAAVPALRQICRRPSSLSTAVKNAWSFETTRSSMSAGAPVPFEVSWRVPAGVPSLTHSSSWS